MQTRVNPREGEGSGQSAAAVPERFTSREVGFLLAILLAAAYAPVLFLGQTLCYRDFGALAIPTAAFHRAAFWAGEIPLWNPLSNCGVPFLAQWGTMALYPPSLIYLLLPLPWSLNFFCILHLWIGGMGMYFLAKRWVGSNWPAAFAAVGFLFNGITQATLTWPNYAAALGLAPWVLLTVEQASAARRGQRVRPCCIASVTCALMLLTGVPELCVLTLGLGTLAVLVKWSSARPERALYVILTIVVGALGLCALQLLPFWELLAHSQRTPGFSGEKWSLPSWGWANFLLPRFHTFVTPDRTAFQYGQEFLSSTYLGGLLLLGSILGAGQTRLSKALAGASLAVALLALGSNGYVYSLLLQVFPSLGIARYPSKFTLVLALTIPLLSAFGCRNLKFTGRVAFGLVLAAGALIAINYAHPLRYDRWHEFWQNSAARLALLVVSASLLIVLRMPRYGQYKVAIQLVILLLLAFDGITHLANQNPTASATAFQGEIWNSIAGIKQPRAGNGRVFITPEAEAKLLSTSSGNLQTDFLVKRAALWSHLNLLDQVPKVNGSATLQLQDQARVQRSLYSGTNVALNAWLDFLNVTAITSSNSVMEWQARPTAFPFVTAGQKPVHALDETNPQFATDVLLEPWSAELDPLKASRVVLSQVEVRANEISFTAEANAPSVAVIPQTWHPAWRADATVGGIKKPLPVLKANRAFQAVLVPAGISRVRLYYWDQRFHAGAVVSAVTAAILLWAFLRAGRVRTEPSVIEAHP